MTKFYNLSVTEIKDYLYKKFFRKSGLESKTENHKEDNALSLERSSSISLNDFKNHEAINPNYLSKNLKNNYFKRIYILPVI